MPEMALRHTAAHAVVPVAEGYEERRDDGEEQEAAAGDNGENDGLPEVRISFGSRRRGRRGQRQFHVVAGERGVHEAEEGLGHGSVEMVAGEVRNCSVGRARFGTRPDSELLESVGLGRGPWKALKERSSTWRLRNRARAASGRGPTNALRWRWRPVSSGRSGSRLFARRLSPSNAARRDGAGEAQRGEVGVVDVAGAQPAAARHATGTAYHTVLFNRYKTMWRD
jgi:hypothetical protein